ncbi:caspase-8-like isoform X2 [Protopterus annectens]|nr:caspase-8-like isoform X2 [Protopterus annectens]XP_043916405.1 caspase-8-like isoform X2 [Protopterus annectens]
MTDESKNFYYILNYLNNQLYKDDVKALQFLCCDHIPLKQQQLIKDAKDLFSQLEQRGMLQEDDKFLIAELLYRIRRFDLLKIIHSTKDMEHKLTKKAYISSFRQLLFDIAESITDEELRTVKYLLKASLNITALEDKTMFEVFTEMEKAEILGQTNLEELKCIFSDVNKALVKKIEIYETTVKDECKELSFSVPRRCSSHFKQDLQSGAQAGADQAAAAAAADDDDVYDMKNIPRGNCLVINNYKFNIEKMNREGTDKDAEVIKKTFEHFHFEVNQFDDVTAERMTSVLTEYQKKDYKRKDCFVCFILTHGDKGVVHGTDVKPVSLHSITSLFTGQQCPSLIGKPKLFFIQACQGHDSHTPVYVHTDTELESDAVPIKESIPDESDFLIGMCTVENYESFRYKTSGSAYIQCLCEYLMQNERADDLLTVLTRVNKKVGSMTFEITKDNVKQKLKQMPEIKSSLRKKLYLQVS